MEKLVSVETKFATLGLKIYKTKTGRNFINLLNNIQRVYILVTVRTVQEGIAGRYKINTIGAGGLSDVDSVKNDRLI